MKPYTDPIGEEYAYLYEKYTNNYPIYEKKPWQAWIPELIPCDECGLDIEGQQFGSVYKPGNFCKSCEFQIRITKELSDLRFIICDMFNTLNELKETIDGI